MKGNVASSARRGHQGEYLDANPLERAPDGEVKVIAGNHGWKGEKGDMSGLVSMVFPYVFHIYIYTCFRYISYVIHMFSIYFYCMFF